MGSVHAEPKYGAYRQSFTVFESVLIEIVV
jgi:hypothetical protein